MLYIYDEALCDDLENSFNIDENNPVVKVCPPDAVIEVIAQIKEGNMTFPIVAVTRSDNIVIDTDRSNFTALHKGVASVMDLETNNLYYEKSIPIKLSYTITILTTNTEDMDELVRELMFKYNDMYFLTIKLPYEADRKIRFGVILNRDQTVTRESYISEYLHNGTLYQSTLALDCDGCVLLHYTPAHLKRLSPEAEYEIDTYEPEITASSGVTRVNKQDPHYVNGVTRVNAEKSEFNGGVTQLKHENESTHGGVTRVAEKEVHTHSGVTKVIQANENNHGGTTRVIQPDTDSHGGVTRQLDTTAESSHGGVTQVNPQKSSSHGGVTKVNPQKQSTSGGVTQVADRTTSEHGGVTRTSKAKEGSAHSGTTRTNKTKSNGSGGVTRTNGTKSNSGGGVTRNPQK